MNKLSFLLLLTLSVPICAMDSRKPSFVPGDSVQESRPYRPSQSVLFILDDEEADVAPAQAEELIHADPVVALGAVPAVANPAQTQEVAGRLCALLQDKPEMALVNDGADFVTRVLGNSISTLQAREVAELVDPTLYPKLLEHLDQIIPVLDVYISQLNELADSPTMVDSLYAMRGAQSFCRDLRDVAREKIQH